MLCSVAVLWGGLLFGSIQAVNLNGNGYELTVAISEDALNLTDNQRLPFLDALKVSFTLLFFFYFISKKKIYTLVFAITLTRVQ